MSIFRIIFYSKVNGWYESGTARKRSQDDDSVNEEKVILGQLMISSIFLLRIILFGKLVLLITPRRWF